MTATQLAALGDRVAEDGVAPHSPLLLRLAELVADVAPGAAAALADAGAPAVVRERALAVATTVLLRRPVQELR